MSASLVGSEMCIRDSAYGGLGAEYLTLTKGFGDPVGVPTHDLCGSMPVSYTHLTLPTICSV
eukprot:11794553-Alexandrium_andersonii.AAC.1